MLFEELRHSLRSFRRAPGLTAISVLTVALGVGAGTALFSVVKAVLLNPLPYPDAGRLVRVAEVMGRSTDNSVSYPDFDDWRRQNRGFTSMAAYDVGPLNAGGGESPQRVTVASVSEDFFDVMGVRPIMGRTFTNEEQTSGKLDTVVVAYGLWQRVYGGDRGIIGRTILLSGMAAKVIGVMPAQFAFPDRTEVWTTIMDRTNGRTAHNFHVVARLRPGVTLEQARADISAIARRIKQQYPNPFQSRDASTVSLYSYIVGQVRPALLMLFAAVGFLLLIVCVNVANLLLVRVTARARELAVRTALGARRWHLTRQMLTESLVLALAGGALGLLVASWSMDLLRILLPAEVPRAADIRIDAGVVAFALSISAAAGILFGALPAWRASRLNVNEALRSGSRSYTGGKRSHRTQAALVVSEVALSLVLLAGAGLLAQSFWKLRAVNPGFQPDHVLTASISFPVMGADAGLISKYRELVRQVRAIPGVQAAGTIRDLPVNPIQRDGNFQIENRRDLNDADARYLIVTPGYLEALRIPLLRGRTFTSADSERAAPAAIISAELARVYFPGSDPIGQRIWFNSFDDPNQPRWLTIVGIADDVRQGGLTARLRPQAYVPYTQIIRTGQLSEGTLVVRTPLDPASLAAAVRSRIQAVDRGAAVTFRTMDAVMSDAVARQRFQMQVLAAFALLALLLAAIGLYGVLSYAVSSERVEIGIRMALGAQPGEVFRMVTGRALLMASIGGVLGLAGCLAVRGLLAALLFGVGAGDPATLAAAAALLLVVAFAASSLPARRATRLDPATALREE
jgi:putative ABC transport system permease protein